MSGVYRVYQADFVSNGNSITIPNRDGCACIALGTNDEVGSVLVTPLTPQSMGTTQTYTVSARAPLMVPITGPFTVAPEGTVTTVANTVLDLLIFRCIPPFLPGRAVLRRTVKVTAGTTFDKYIPVLGRKDVSVSFSSLGNFPAGCYINTVMWDTTGGALVRQAFALPTAVAQATYGLHPVNQPGTPATGEHIAFPCDYLEINITSSTSDIYFEALGYD